MSTQITVGSRKGKRKRSTEEILARFAKRIKGRRAAFTMGSSIGRTAAGFPRQQRVQMRYSTHGTWSLSAIILMQNIFSCNSLYDPDRTSVGHQPSNYDTWTSLYNHYCVLRSRLDMTFNLPTQGSDPIVCGINVCASTSLPSTTVYTTNIESGAKFNVMGPAYENVLHLSMPFSTSKFFNQKNPVNKDELCGSISANPVDEAFFIVWAQAQEAGVGGTSLFWTATITYEAVFFEPTNVTQS